MTDAQAARMMAQALRPFARFAKDLSHDNKTVLMEFGSIQVKAADFRRAARVLDRYYEIPTR